MSLFSKLLGKIPRPTTKHVVVGAVYAALLVSSIGLGLASRQSGSAAVIRDCGGASHNSIDNTGNNGGCGAADANEFIADASQNNPSDLQTIYNFFGLSTNEYDRFKQTAKQGMAYKDGRIVVDNQVVMTDAWSIGRQRFSYSKVYPIPGAGSTYSSWHTDVLKQDLPVMVMFDDAGNAEFAVLNACGNPVGGNRVSSSVTCNSLVKTQDKTNPNKYTFTTDAAVSGNAKISRVVYTFSDDGTTVTKNSTTEAVEHTFKKSGDVSVTVFATVPGGKEIQATVIANCKKHIDYVAPMFVCTALVANMPDPTKDHKFRFTIKTSSDKNTTVKDADFILDDTVTTTGVNTKDGDGNIYKEYEFTDVKEHAVKVTVYFNTLEGVKSDSGHCKATVKAKEQPKCEVPGFENLPPNDERCGYCLPGVPKGDARCTPVEECKPGVPKGAADCNPPVLVNSGPGNIAGLFAGTSILGTFGHAFVSKRRAARKVSASETRQA